MPISSRNSGVRYTPLVGLSRDSLLNIGGIALSGAYPFINRMKEWGLNVTSDSNTPPYPLCITSDGYPTGTITSNQGNFVDTPTSYTGDYIVDWVGNTGGSGGSPSIQIQGGSGTPTITSGSAFVAFTGTGTLRLFGNNGSVQFNVGSSSGFTITFLTAGTYTSLTNFRFYRADQATALATSPFNPDFVSSIKSMNPRILRFLGWLNINAGNQTVYANRALTSNIAYNYAKWIPGNYVGDSSATGSTNYTCTNGTNHNASAYVDKEMVQCRFLTTDTGTPTMNRGGLGAIPIVNNNPNSSWTTGTITTNQLATLVYDSTLNAYLYKAGGISWLDGGEVAIEDMVTLCNQCGCDMWWNVSHLTDIASITSFMQLIAPILNGKLYIEYSNEVWNFAGGFDQTGYANKMATALGFTSGTFHSFYGLKIAQIMTAAKTAWSGAGRSLSDLRGVIAYQAGSIQTLSDTPFVYRMEGNELSSYGFNTAPNRPGDLVDVFAFAPYVEGGITQAFDFNYVLPLTTLYTAADNWFSGNTAASRAFFDNDIRQGLDQTSSLGTGTMLYAVQNIYPGAELARAAPTWSTTKYNICYEGSPECLAPSVSELTALGAPSPSTYGGNPINPPNGRIQNALEDYKLSPMYAQLVRDWMFQIWSSAATPGLTWPAWFAMNGQTGQGEGFPDQWSLYSGDIYATPYASKSGVTQFNAGN